MLRGPRVRVGLQAHYSVPEVPAWLSVQLLCHGTVLGCRQSPGGRHMGDRGDGRPLRTRQIGRVPSRGVGSWPVFGTFPASAGSSLFGSFGLPFRSSCGSTEPCWAAGPCTCCGSPEPFWAARIGFHNRDMAHVRWAGGVAHSGHFVPHPGGRLGPRARSLPLHSDLIACTAAVLRNRLGLQAIERRSTTTREKGLCGNGVW